MSFQALDADLPAQAAAGATLTTILGNAPDNFVEPSFTLEKLALTSPTLVTGQATNYATINFRQVRAGSVIATLGSLVLNAAGVTLPAETEVNVPITGTPVILAGDTIDTTQVQTGTGLALPAGINARCELA